MYSIKLLYMSTESINTIFLFITISTPPHHHTLSHFKQTLLNKYTLYKGRYYFSPWNDGGSYDNDSIVLIGATDPSL